MLKDAVEGFIALMQSLGYSFVRNACRLRSYARLGRESGDRYVKTATAISWSSQARSVMERDRRLKAVAAFAVYAHAEDPRHEIPPRDFYGYRPSRPTPFIFTAEQIGSVIHAASQLKPRGSQWPQLYTTLFGLLACTGLRISEALGLRLGDITADGLVIRNAKFRKNRLVPLHDTTDSALRAYLRHRERLVPVDDDHVFLDRHGQTLRYRAVYHVFRKLTEQLGWRRGTKRPTLHGFRHTFAVRVLEQGPPSREHVGQYLVALSTYLGHATLSATYWYVESTPQLMRDISASREARRGRELS